MLCIAARQSKMGMDLTPPRCVRPRRTMLEDLSSVELIWDDHREVIVVEHRILPWCHQDHGKNTCIMLRLACNKGFSQAGCVCRSLFSMLIIACSGEQIQPVEASLVQHVLKIGPISHSLCIHLNNNTILIP